MSTLKFTFGRIAHDDRIGCRPRPQPLLLAGLVCMVTLKALSAGLALRCVGLRWRSALGMGLGLAQLGEFSFLLVAQGVSEGLVDREQYGRMLFIALGTLLATPWLLRWGLRWAEDERPADEHGGPETFDNGLPKVAMFGIGLIGRQLSSRLESSGADVCMVDLSPVNLYPFAQLGFRTIAGDARDPAVLERVDVAACRLVVVAVPDDLVAIDIVRAVRLKAPRVPVLVRCRYELNRSTVLQAGATRVVTEEAEAAGRLLQHCESLLGS